MSTVLFIVTIPTEEEEQRLKNQYIAKKFESKLQKGDTRPNLFEKRESLSINMEPTTPTTSQASTLPNRRKSESDNLVNLDGLGLSEITGCSQTEGCSLKSINEVDTASHSGRKSWEGIREMLSSSKSKLHRPKNTELDLPLDAPMETVLRHILQKFEIKNPVWSKNLEEKMFQVMFNVEVNKLYENLLDKLHEWGIGDREGSSVSVLNCIASKTFSKSDDSESDQDSKRDKLNAAKQSAWERFMDSVKGRLNVVQIVNNVRQDATITFDFCVLIICAAIMAAFGLVDDSTIFLAASMLISPLMGPIIAAIFGTVIKDSSLQRLGLKNELIGICLSTAVGFVFGLISCGLDSRYSMGEGMSTEMMSRCDKHSLLVGVFTAIPSGAAAAVAILGGNIGSLVGVAISASLLPPAVNSGVLWALACVYKLFETDSTRYSRIVKSTFYSDDQATELAILGSISMCLTLINVMCIYVMGILMLKIKEIAPVIARQKRSAWQRDIRIARILKKSGYSADQAIMDEFTSLPKEDQKALGINCDFLRNMNVDEAIYQHTWSPLGISNLVDRYDENYPTVHHLERLYSTIHHNQHSSKRRHYSLSKPKQKTIEISKSYRRFTDHGPRHYTNPPAFNQDTSSATNMAATDISPSSTLRSDASTPTGSSQRRRKFIVTPAQLDTSDNNAGSNLSKTDANV